MFTALSLPLKVWTTVFLPLSEGLVAGAEDTAPALGSSGFESEVGEKTDKHETLAEALRQRPVQGSCVCVGRDWACWGRPVILILKTRKLKPKGVKALVQGHIARVH